jgi:hypothetical protein
MMPSEFAEVWAVECQESDGTWLPVEVFIDKSDADEECLDWKADAGHINKWRVKRYVPNPQGNQP